MATKYPGLSPFVYCNDNPIRFIDPDGMEIDDYFDKITGKFLGTDNAKTDNIMVISESIYQMTTIGCDKTGLSEDTKTSLLQNNSELTNGNNNGLSDKAASNILNHYYQEAGYDLNELDVNSVSPSANTPKQEFYDRALARPGITTSGKLLIGVEKSEIGSILNTKSDMINMFRHERGGHGNDYLRAFKGEIPGYSYLRSSEWESRATLLQVKDQSWQTVSPQFRSHMISTYGKYMPSFYKH